MKNYALGLDLGSNSVGWAAVAEEPASESNNIIAGVRIFPEGTELVKGREQSRNLDRREARQARRQHDRRSRRKKKLRHILQEARVFPADASESMMIENPYHLRRRALDEPLQPEEFARALLHLNQRRGFKSNKKARGEEDKEQQGIKEEIQGLEKEMMEGNARTLGEYFSINAETMKIRKRHTSRAMYLDEFEKMWDAQAAFNPGVWTDQLKTLVRETIFHQRPLKSQKHLIGNCELEPDEPRCHKASWFAQQYRVLCDLNNLLILTPYGERPLSPEERERLYEKLMTQVTDLKIDAIKEKILGLSTLESLNFERTKRDSFPGNFVEARLRRLFKKEFDEKAQWLRETAWETLIREEPEEFEDCARKWGLTDAQIEEMFQIAKLKSIPDGYMNYSLKAIRNILPHLEAGMNLHEARIRAGYEKRAADAIGYLPPIDPEHFRNPVVSRALSETRKVVNALIREHGLPARITVEMARETKGSIPERAKKNIENLRRKAENDRVRDEIAKYYGDSRKVTHDDIEKYKLWEECNRQCPYTGATIGMHHLFGDNCLYDIEHILPYPQSLDDSFMNKTLCARAENIRKHNRTPYEAYHGTPQYEDILSRVSKNYNMPYEKRRRFSLKEMPTGFSNRQLVDSSYIATAVVDYLKLLGIPVSTTRGQITAELRRQWGLNSILKKEIAEEEGEKKDGEKMRDDHRHHAVDAVTIALTTRAHINTLRRKYDFGRGERFPSPFDKAGIDRESFRGAVKQCIEAINVSHRPQRRVAGCLNEETNYGPTSKKGIFVHRVPLQSLTAAKADRIADPMVKAIVCERLRMHGIEPGKGSSALPAAVFQEPLSMKARSARKAPSINSVRILESLSNPIGITGPDGKPYRFVEPGSNHHIAIFEYTDDQGRKRRCKEIVTRFEAAQRVLRKEPVIRRTHSDHPEAKFLMSLAINDMAWVGKDGEKALCRVQKISTIPGEQGVDIFFRRHTATRIDMKEDEIRMKTLSPDKFKVTKVSVDPLGRIHPCHD